MKAAEWIDRVKHARGWESDYRVAKELGLRANTISTYRARESTMDDDVAVRVAGAIGEMPEFILIDQARERSKSDEAKAALDGLLKRLGKNWRKRSDTNSALFATVRELMNPVVMTGSAA